ncbi:TetR family transcriptional regulator [Rhodococcus sp. D2-41]|uniref:TetR family transcriptional regulator C-terminal domain-containing protein n=1 Tax=Speluncibacter jeojiensis TaxID=2710754 RepID=A0A9X4LZI6_9ACTN|nr:TetR/AcrR family transcriptional regulator [Rhodococcus sp. D2-41]MDG3011543.1 TetR family transcriptional regulator [Rhodococcus sp. D2-41]MDG3015099.1 TetR family transcriptional regulator C-terminal domain-containing protein [Corynebacteriales bacterium D3-21]
MTPRTDQPGAKRVTRRRAETRQRLLDAALDVFADNGFGRSTVEQVCERGGYTRGAFYSNFASLDEMFLAMWEQRSRQLVEDFTAAADRVAAAGAAAQADDMLAAVTTQMADAVPVDDRWYRVNAEFTAHALRTPSLKKALAAREQAITAALVQVVRRLLAAGGRRILGDPADLGRALVAVHDGTSVQCLVEPDDARVWDLRRDLFVRVLTSYSEPVEGDRE